MTHELQVRSAEELVAALETVDPRAWRDAALAALEAGGAFRTNGALDACVALVDPARWWALEDDVESALFRLTTREGVGVVHGSREFQRIREATRAAVAVLASGTASGDDARALVSHFLELR